MFRKTSLLIPLLLALLAACGQAPTPEAASPSELAPMFGTSGTDIGYGLAKHSLGVYVVGDTSGNLISTPAPGGFNAFILKKDQNGRLLWGKQFGTPSSATASDVASDASDNAYVVGTTDGDIYIRKYAPGGGHVWTRQFGTSGYDYAYSVAVYGSSIYVVGSMNGTSFLRKYTTGGGLAWTRHFKTGTSVHDVAVDQSGYVYVSGGIRLSGGGSSMLLQKLTPNGGTRWIRYVQYSNHGYGYAVAVSGNSVYLVGDYLFNNDHNDSNVAVTKYTTDGGVLWRNFYGAYGGDHIRDASADSKGNLYFTGTTGTSFAGPNQGVADGYVVKVSYNGYWLPLWSKTIGTSSSDFGQAVVVRTLATKACAVYYSNSCNQIYAAGSTDGSLPYVVNQGGTDAYLRRLYSGDGGTVWTK